jgi:hypothetical protein
VFVSHRISTEAKVPTGLRVEEWFWPLLTHTFTAFIAWVAFIALSYHCCINHCVQEGSLLIAQIMSKHISSLEPTKVHAVNSHHKKPW